MIERNLQRGVAAHRQADDVRLALDKTVETFGRLDFAFNNAGSEQAPTATADISEEEWDKIMSINLRGMFLCMKYEIPLMLKQGGGAIVNAVPFAASTAETLPVSNA